MTAAPNQLQRLILEILLDLRDEHACLGDIMLDILDAQPEVTV